MEFTQSLETALTIDRHITVHGRLGDSGQAVLPPRRPVLG